MGEYGWFSPEYRNDDGFNRSPGSATMTSALRSITSDQVKLLRLEGEGLAVEFKESYTPRMDADLVAFANARGGTLLLGVRDDGSVRGESLTNDLKAKINSLARNCTPIIPIDLGNISIRRNELIADIFFRMRKVERIGMGIPKMKAAMLAAGLDEPVFEPGEFFRVIFRRSPRFAMKDAASASGKVSGKVSGKIPAGILSALGKRPRATITELAKIVGVSGRTIERHLKRLREQGALRRAGPSRGGYWDVGE
jgi:predicted HTH transcriptional regulator